MKNIKYLILFTLIFIIGSCGKDEPSIDNRLSASFTIPSGTLFTDMSIEFSNTSTGAQSYDWDFGDGNNSSATSPTYSYSESGSYSINLVASDQDGNTMQASNTISIIQAPEPITITNCNQFGDLIWTDHNPNGVDYIIDCDFNMKVGDLNIEEGTLVEVADGKQIIIENEASLKCDGATISGQTKSPGSWKGIRLIGNGSSIENSTIEYGGRQVSSTDGYAILLESSGTTQAEEGRLVIGNSTIKESTGYGIYCGENTVIRGKTFLGEFENVFIQNCTKAGLSVSVDNTDKLDGIRIENCDKDNRIEIYESIFNGSTFNGGSFFSASKARYYISGLIQLNGGNSIIGHKIAAGADFLMGENSEIRVGSSTKFTFQGTQLEPIIFKGEEQSKGFWNGIHIDSNRKSGNLIEYCEIYDAGAQVHTVNDFGTPTARGGNLTIEASNVEVINSHFENSASCGILKHLGSEIVTGNLSYRDIAILGLCDFF